jgi:hypothetical protein
MSTDVYFDFGPTPNIDNAWFLAWKRGADPSDTQRIGHLAAFLEDVGYGMFDPIMEVIARHPIFDSLALAELKGIILAAEKRGPSQPDAVFDSDFDDRLTLPMLESLVSSLLGNYWYLRVD